MGLTTSPEAAPARTHRYRVDEADFDRFSSLRAELIGAIRAAHPGLASATLTRLNDGSYTDVWRWSSLPQMIAAAQDLADFPQAPAVMSLTKDNVAVDGVVVDER